MKYLICLIAFSCVACGKKSARPDDRYQFAGQWAATGLYCTPATETEVCTPSPSQVAACAGVSTFAGIRFSEMGDKAVVAGQLYRTTILGDVVAFDLNFSPVEIRASQETNHMILRFAPGCEMQFSFEGE